MLLSILLRQMLFLPGWYWTTWLVVSLSVSLSPPCISQILAGYLSLISIHTHTHTLPEVITSPSLITCGSYLSVCISAAVRLCFTFLCTVHSFTSLELFPSPQSAFYNILFPLWKLSWSLSVSASLTFSTARTNFSQPCQSLHAIRAILQWTGYSLSRCLLVSHWASRWLRTHIWITFLHLCYFLNYICFTI